MLKKSNIQSKIHPMEFLNHDTSSSHINVKKDSSSNINIKKSSSKHINTRVLRSSKAVNFLKIPNEGKKSPITMFHRSKSIFVGEGNKESI